MSTTSAVASPKLTTPRSSSSSRPTLSFQSPNTAQRLASSRPPVLIEWTAHALRYSLVQTASTAASSPQVVVPQMLSLSHVKWPAWTDPPSAWYRVWAPLLSVATRGHANRKVILVNSAHVEFGEHWPRSVREALLRVLLDTLAVPAVTMVSAGQVLFTNFPSLPNLLVVSTSATHVACRVHAEGHDLPFTFQCVERTTADDEDEEGDDKDDIVLALLQSLMACPRSVRKDVIQNIVFVGTGLFSQPQLPRLVTRRLQTVLRLHAAVPESNKPKSGSSPNKNDDQEDDTLEHTTESPNDSHATHFPVAWSSLAGLADHVGLVQVTSVDTLAWTGAHQWATYGHGRDAQLGSWKWHKRPLQP